MLSVAELRDRLDWPGVDEVVNVEYRLVYLYVWPARAELKPIYFCLGEDRSFLQQFGFGEWHDHPGEIDEAVEMARQLVRGEQCVVEERDATGRYLGSGPYPPAGIHDSLGAKTAWLRRVSFGRDPVAESIDFSHYVRVKHGWLTHEHKAELERAYRAIGMAIPDW